MLSAGSYRACHVEVAEGGILSKAEQGTAVVASVRHVDCQLDGVALSVEDSSEGICLVLSQHEGGMLAQVNVLCECDVQLRIACIDLLLHPSQVLEVLYLIKTISQLRN